MDQSDFKQILSVFEGTDEEDGQVYSSYKTQIDDSFKLNPEILGTIVISILDTCAWSVPEQDLEMFERQVMNFINNNYASRFKSKNILYRG